MLSYVYSYAQRPPIETKAPLVAVKVYPNRAQLTHTVSVNVPPGEHEIVLQNLSRNLDDNTLQVGAKGEGVIQMAAARFRPVEQKAANPRTTILIDSLLAVRREIQRHEAMSYVIQKDEELLLFNKNVGGSERGVSAEELKRLSDLVRVRLTESRMTNLDLGWRLDSLRKAEASLNVRLSNLSSETARQYKEVVVSFSRKTAGPVVFTLSYMAVHAAWVPLYDLRCERIHSPAALSMKAQVFNNTGVDWENVSLALSSANPTANAVAPVFRPTYVNIYQPPPAQYGDSYRKGRADYSTQAMPKAAPAASGEAARDEDMNEEAPAPSESAADYVTASSTGLSQEYDIKLKYTIPANAQPHSVDVRLVELNGIFRHYAAPGRDTDVFLQLLLTDWRQYELLPGALNIYFGGSLVGRSAIQPSATDTLSIGLGRDGEVKVTRETDKIYASTKTFGSNTKQEQGYKYTIRNNKNQPIYLIVEDGLPVTATKEIEVKMVEQSGARYEAATGRLTWEIHLEPGRSEEKRLQYELRYPTGRQLNFFTP